MTFYYLHIHVHYPAILSELKWPDSVHEYVSMCVCRTQYTYVSISVPCVLFGSGANRLFSYLRAVAMVVLLNGCVCTEVV